MGNTQLPKIDLKNSETGCCPKFDPEPWNEKKLKLDRKLFVKVNTIQFWHTPLNAGPVFTKVWKKIEEANAAGDEFLFLSAESSPWKGEHYFAVEKEVPGLEMERISGTFLTKVFEGDYNETSKWVKEMEYYVADKDKKLKKLYFFYTTCPKCAKHYGKNYVVAFAQIG